MPKTYMHIPLGYAATLTTDATSAVVYVQVTPGSINTPASLAASSSVIVGPFNDARYYDVEYTGNAPTVSIAQSGVYTKADDDLVVKTTDDITALTPLAEVNVAEIAVDANGTAIATAVNGILAILVAAGLMVEEEV